MSENEHSMITRSKKKELEEQDILSGLHGITDEINENGDLSDIIDPSCNADFDNDMFQKELNRLRGKSTPITFKISSSPKKSKKKKKKNGNENLIELFSQILLMNMVMQNGVKSRKGGIRKKRSHPSIIDLLNISGGDEGLSSGIILDIEEQVSSNECGDENDSEEEEDEGEDEEDEEDSEMEEYDDEYSEEDEDYEEDIPS